MVSTRGRKQGRGKAGNNEEEEEDAEMVDEKRGEYEERRAQRMKENMERMKSLGIVDLSNQLKRRPTKRSTSRKANCKDISTHTPRRSSRSLFLIVIISSDHVFSIWGICFFILG